LRTLLAASILLAAHCPAEAAQTPANAQSRSAATFEDLAHRAAAAREAGHVIDAIESYQRAVRLRPKWDEGWWYLATLRYEQKKDAAALDALTRFLALKPQAGPAWALRGLCEFRLARYDRARASFDKARTLGIPGNDELRRATWYHTAILMLQRGEFELAVEPLTLLARSEAESPSLTEAIGLLVLRLADVPGAIPPARRDLVMAAGAAGYSWLARAGDEADRRFTSLVERYPSVSFVHYAHGVFLLQRDSDAALAAFRREIDVNPDSAYPHLEIAFELLRRGDAAAARASAERAVALAPALFASHNALGRALAELGEIEPAIRELELAVKLAPEIPEVHFSLANAYARAGRTADAARERAVFLKLNQRP
jgi:tetratricopeptide (TPR) repeat protein